MKKLLGFLLFPLFFLPMSCDNPVVDTVVDMSFSDLSTLLSVTKGIIELANLLETQNDGLKNNLVTTSENVARRIEEKDEPASITEQFTTEWTSIENDYTGLQLTLNNVRDSAQKLFTMLRTNNNYITDPGLKQTDMVKTDKLERKWSDQYAKVKTNLEMIGKLVTKGNNFKVYLTNEIGRQEVGELLDSLSYISDNAEKLAYKIKSFSTNLIKVFARENIPIYENGKIKDAEKPFADNTTGEVFDKPQVQKPNATCNKAWCEFNVLRNDVKGLNIHLNLTLTNCQYDTCVCEVALFTETGTELTLNRPPSIWMVPDTKNETINNVVLFLPNDLLDSEKGSYKYKALVNVYKRSNGAVVPDKIGETEYLRFNYSNY